VDWVVASGKNLTTIYATHGHGDHFFGIGALLDRFPSARAVATRDVVKLMRQQASADVVANFWSARFPDQIPERLPYNDVHQWLAESNAQTRRERISALDTIESLDPRSVIAGHKRPENEDSPKIIEETRKYIRDFDRLVESTTTAQELYDKMLELYPDRVNPGERSGFRRAPSNRDLSGVKNRSPSWQRRSRWLKRRTLCVTSLRVAPSAGSFSQSDSR
jgi:Metallo-beta-lactamase superfamily